MLGKKVLSPFLKDILEVTIEKPLYLKKPLKSKRVKVKRLISQLSQHEQFAETYQTAERIEY